MVEIFSKKAKEACSFIRKFRVLQILPSKYFKVLIFYLCRFRGYFQALMSNVQALVCHPRSLFHRSDSKSSLNIGVRPIRPMYAGVVRMEMHNINGKHSPNLAARRSRPQNLVNGTGNKTASKGTGCIFFLVKQQCAALNFIISQKIWVAMGCVIFSSNCNVIQWGICRIVSILMLKL